MPLGVQRDHTYLLNMCRPSGFGRSRACGEAALAAAVDRRMMVSRVRTVMAARWCRPGSAAPRSSPRSPPWPPCQFDVAAHTQISIIAGAQSLNG